MTEFNDGEIPISELFSRDPEDLARDDDAIRRIVAEMRAQRARYEETGATKARKKGEQKALPSTNFMDDEAG